MAIAINTPKHEGYTACARGISRQSNPYLSLDTILRWYEWDAGWDQAYHENKYGIEQ